MEIELSNLTTHDDIVGGQGKQYCFIKKLVIESKTYPSLKIDQLDLCPDGSETFDVWINICAHMSKDELLEFLKVANDRTTFVLDSVEGDQLPGKITIEIFPKLKDLNEE